MDFEKAFQDLLEDVKRMSYSELAEKSQRQLGGAVNALDKLYWEYIKPLAPGLIDNPVGLAKYSFGAYDFMEVDCEGRAADLVAVFEQVKGDYDLLAFDFEKESSPIAWEGKLYWEAFGGGDRLKELLEGFPGEFDKRYSVHWWVHAEVSWYSLHRGELKANTAVRRYDAWAMEEPVWVSPSTDSLPAVLLRKL